MQSLLRHPCASCCGEAHASARLCNLPAHVLRNGVHDEVCAERNIEHDVRLYGSCAAGLLRCLTLSAAAGRHWQRSSTANASTVLPLAWVAGCWWLEA